MADDLHNASELIEELEGLSIKTTQGSYVKMEDIRRLIEKREEARVLDEEEKPKPKTLDEARAGAKKFLTEKIGKQPVREPGKALPATDPQPSSRT
jgi:arginyl-tRNA synthetase